MDLAFPAGRPPARPGPLARFLPPIEVGSVARFLDGGAVPGGWILDPFGASPRLAIEAAQARGAVVAVSNPVIRFVLERRIEPLSPTDLSGAVARLAAAPKDDGRLETFLLDLYASECAHCGGPVTVDYYVWDREAAAPVIKAYICPECHHTGEEPTSSKDVAAAAEFRGRSLARATAAERAASAEDPDRGNVEEALDVYTGRALYALMALLQKVEQVELQEAQRQAVQGLMLSAFDAANGLWGHPETRARPKQLIASPRFREVNVWRALERAQEEWSFDDPGIELRRWPESGLPEPGTLAVFAGPIRDLETVLPDDVPLIVTAFPRPNQAFWTLSALWASWLWGREAASPLRVALRRRRYDWTWHAAALRGALAALAPRQADGSAVAGFLPEAEHGFLAAALAGLDATGYRLRGQALRLPDGQGVLVWERGRHRPEAESEPLKAVLRRAAERALGEHGAPAGYGWLHAAGSLELARENRFAALWSEDGAPPLGRVTEAMEQLLGPGGGIERMVPRVDIESGLYWLTDPGSAQTPLADRVEIDVLAALREAPREVLEVEVRLCQQFRGLLTPDRRWVLACLASYAREQEDGVWGLRQEDEASVRAKDVDEIRWLLAGIGAQLGFAVVEGEGVRWQATGGPGFDFRVQETASLGGALRLTPGDGPVLVLPGGRASLVAERERRDPRIRAWLNAGGRIVKFRHIRRLSEDRSLTRENLAERLGIDPPENEDPQLPLL